MEDKSRERMGSPVEWAIFSSSFILALLAPAVNISRITLSSSLSLRVAVSWIVGGAFGIGSLAISYRGEVRSVRRLAYSVCLVGMVAFLTVGADAEAPRWEIHAIHWGTTLLLGGAVAHFLLSLALWRDGGFKRRLFAALVYLPILPFLMRGEIEIMWRGLSIFPGKLLWGMNVDLLAVSILTVVYLLLDILIAMYWGIGSGYISTRERGMWLALGLFAGLSPRFFIALSLIGSRAAQLPETVYDLFYAIVPAIFYLTILSYKPPVLRRKASGIIFFLLSSAVLVNMYTLLPGELIGAIFLPEQIEQACAILASFAISGIILSSVGVPGGWFGGGRRRDRGGYVQATLALIRRLAEASDPDSIYRAPLEEIERLMRPSFSSILLKQEGVYVPKGPCSLRGELQFREGETLVDYLESRGGILDFSAFAQDHPEVERKFEGGDRCELVVPLSSRGELVGMILLGAKSSGKPYDERDLDFLEDVAWNVAEATSRRLRLTG
ncbi:MAG: GAF domain-containing protein [bacterium]